MNNQANGYGAQSEAPNGRSKKPRIKHTFRQRFVAKLQELSRGEAEPITNKELRTKLGWDEVRYKRVHTELRNENKIKVGKGMGGTVSLVAASEERALRLFISYSHVDEKAKSDLLKHLRPLERRRLVSPWEDGQLEAGDQFNAAISKRLMEADIILLLVSIDFLNSAYCFEKELDCAMKRHESENATVIPIILRSCDWQQAPFKDIHVLPEKAKPIFPTNDLDGAFTEVSKAIERIVVGRRKSAATS